MTEHKILFSGTTGAGKTTAISRVSEIRTLTTEVRNTDATVNKSTTTVGLDYGELTLDNGDKLRLYGTPGQVRFDFMWELLARGALGLIILIDNSSADPLADLSMYVKGFERLIKETACVVAITRTETHPEPGIDCFIEHLESCGVVCPVIAADIRDTLQVVELLELLMLQLEVNQEVSSYAE